MFTYTLDGQAVTPSGEWKISYQKNAGQIFFRRILEGELVFRGADYTYIMGQTECTDMEFIIYCKGEEFWTGSIKFPYGFTKIDIDQCWLSGTPEVVDEYSCIMDHYETEFLLSTNGGTTAAAEIRTCPGGVLLHTLPAGTTIYGYLNAIINNASYVSGMNCGLTLRSSFMWRDNFPNGDNYAAAYNIDNYISGVAPGYAGTNRLEYIRMWTNTSLRSSFGGTLCDNSHFIKFKDYEDFLRNAFNAYWYIDQNGEFRIEHLHFFDPDFAHSDFADGIDLTALAARCQPTYASRRNKYEFLIDHLFDSEIWKWQHYEDTEGTITHGSDFDAPPIFYGTALGAKSDCVPGDFKEKEWYSPNFWSDIYWAYQLLAAGTPDTISCPGLCFIDIDTAPAPDQVRCETGAISALSTINGHCSTANLLEAYHTYGRVFLQGYMNDAAAAVIDTFDSEIDKQLQDKIEFPLCCDEEFDPMDYIVTEMGSGRLYSAELSRLNRSLTVQLTY